MKSIRSFLLLMLIGTGSAIFSQTVTIGTQVWMNKNLDVATFRNGDSIPHSKTDQEWKKAGESKQPAWCYYDNDPANGAKYGKLYNWYAVIDSRGLAPVGYHIPSKEEWELLIDNLGGNKTAGNKLISSIGWNNNRNGTNVSGFNGLPGGRRYTYESDIKFELEGNCSFWWSSSGHSPDHSWFWPIDDGEIILYWNYCFRANGLSVRSIKD